MRFKTTAFLLIIAVLVGGYIFLYERKKPTTEEWKEKSKKVFDIKSDRIEKLEIKKGEALISCEKKDGKWEMTSPLRYTADSGEIDRVLSKIEFLKWERELKKAEWDAKKEDFGVAQPRAEVDFWVKGKKSTMKLGKDAPLGGNLYLLIDGQDSLYLVSKDLFDSVNKEPNDFRDKTVLPVIASDVRSFEVKRAKDKLVCAREGEEWKIKEPIVSDAEAGEIDGLLDKLRDLKVENFAADGTINPPDYGLDSPQAEVTVYTGAEQAFKKVLFGSKVQDTENIYARREGLDTVFAIKPEILTELNKEVKEFKNRTVLKFDKEKVENVRLAYPDMTIACQKTGDAWEIQEPEKANAKKDKIDSLLQTASSLRCKEFVEPASNLADYGLDKPELQAKFTITGGEEKAILIGKQKETEGYYAKLPDKDEVFLLNTYDVDDLKPKLSDLKEEEKKEEEKKEEPKDIDKSKE